MTERDRVEIALTEEKELRECVFIAFKKLCWISYIILYLSRYINIISYYIYHNVM